MSFPTLSVYSELIATYPTWTSLSGYLSFAYKLRIDDNSTPESPYALIRYVKGQTDLSNPVARAFRSVVWDTIRNRPVSVTSWKSADGETLPDAPSKDYTVEQFHDGTLVGLFWDAYNGRWRIHTRSVLDARCRYYAAHMTFADMFAAATRHLDLSALDKSRSYSFVLQHPANRIVCSVSEPRAVLVDVCAIADKGAVEWLPTPSSPMPPMADWAAVRSTLADFNARFRHNYQGFVIKAADGRRWKLRTTEYNRVRGLRGNSPRLDFQYLWHWRNGNLHEYLTLYPEERGAANALVSRWKTVTSEVYHIYCDVFKARSMDRKAIPPKYRPLVYGLHSLYMETLKPAGKTVDWKACLEHMNNKDVPQMLYVLSWEYRAGLRATGAVSIPIEPPASVGTTVDDKGADDASAAAADGDKPEPPTAPLSVPDVPATTGSS